MKEFFGFGGYEREVEGFLSWEHLTFVSFLMVCMVVLAIVFAFRSRGVDAGTRNRVLAGAAILMDGVEILKIVIKCTVGGNPMAWLSELPLYMCSIQLITLPLAAFSRGKIKEAALDFLCIFGVLGAVMGTYCAGNNYSCYPVLSFENVFSGITHSIAGFASLYIMFTGMAGMKKRNIGITCAIILFFSVAAYTANILLDTNYMFLMRGDGTPYEILFRLVSGHPVLYPAGVVGLFLVYIALMYVFFGLMHKKHSAVAVKHENAVCVR